MQRKIYSGETDYVKRTSLENTYESNSRSNDQTENTELGSIDADGVRKSTRVNKRYVNCMMRIHRKI